MATRQADAEAEIFWQVDGAQKFQRPSFPAEGDAFDGEQRRADLHAKQFCAAGGGKICADRLLRVLDGEAELVLEDAINAYRDQVALFELETDLRRIEGVLDRDWRFVGEPQTLELPDGALAQLLPHGGIVAVRH